MIWFKYFLFILVSFNVESRENRFWHSAKNRFDDVSFQSAPQRGDNDRFRSRNNENEKREYKSEEISGIIDEHIDNPFGEDMPPMPQFNFDRFNPNFDAFNPFFHRQSNWWEGENVCVDKEETEEGNSPLPFNFQSKSCIETDLAFKCTTKIHRNGIQKSLTVSMHCCHGFVREGARGKCVKVELNSLLETIKMAGGSIFMELISFSGLIEKFQKENLTVFCPTDLALKSFHEDFENNVVVMTPMVHKRKRNADSNDHLVLSHVVPGFIRSSDFMDEKVLLTETFDTGIRLNVYNLPNRVMTANCAKVLSTNHFATNGMVHVVNSVLPPINQPLWHLLATNPKYSIFKTMLEENHLMEVLMQDGHMTVLAPTDEAFHQLDAQLRTKLMGGEGCVANILKYHILPNVVCQEILPPRARSSTMFGPDVKFRVSDERLLVNGLNVVTGKQQMATNGVLYPLEGVLIPSQAKPVTSVLDETQLSDLVDLLEETKLADKLNNMKNFTFFAPTNRAIQNVRPYLDELRRNSPDKLQQLVMYHVGYPATTMCLADNNQLISTGIEKKIRFNQFTSVFGLSHQITAQCAKVIEMDGQMCGGVIHIVERVLIPPEGNLAQVIASNQSFSLFRKLVQIAEFEEEIAKHGPYTILAPTDSAFYSLPEDFINQLVNDKDMAEALVRNHILPEILCCAGVPPLNYGVEENVRALSGNLHSLHRFRGAIYIGGAQVRECDIMADNGVTHAINSVLTSQMGSNTHYVHRKYRKFP